MSLEHIGAVEALLGRRSAAGAEATHHRTLIVSKGVPILVVFPGEALYVVLARDDGALLGAFVLVGQHMRFEVFEDAAAVRNRTESSLGTLIV